MKNTALFGLSVFMVVSSISSIGQEITNSAGTTITVVDQKTSKALAAVKSGDVTAIRASAEEINDPAAKLYLEACAERIAGNPQAAIKKAADVVAFHYQEMDWLSRSELLCAELYMEMGMTNAAEVTARQVQKLYEGTDIAKQAGALRLKIKNVSNEVQE